MRGVNGDQDVQESEENEEDEKWEEKLVKKVGEWFGD